MWEAANLSPSSIHTLAQWCINKPWKAGTQYVNIQDRNKLKSSQNQTCFTSLTYTGLQRSPTGKSGQQSPSLAGQPNQRQLLVEESNIASNKPWPSNPPRKLREFLPPDFHYPKVANHQSIAIFVRERKVFVLLWYPCYFRVATGLEPASVQLTQPQNWLVIN